MKLKKVFLLCGIPASGKSTWIRSQLIPGAEWISRDNVRFAIVSENEEYFSHEDEVFDTFINYINQTLEKDNIHTIYIDATHLNQRARDKVLRKVHKDNIEELNCICFDIPLETCIARNSLRIGRSKVPETAIRNMFKVYQMPNKDEGFTHIYKVNENGIIKQIE